MPAVPTRGSRRQPEASRNAILQAALAEFAQEGLAGARVDAIAEAAGVNKALLYYYFHDKETLYGAVLDGFFERLLERVMTVCDRPGTAGERFLSYARAHFDSIAESPYYARIFMGELMSASRGGPHPSGRASSPSTFNRSACASSVCCRKASTRASFAPSIPRNLRRTAVRLNRSLLPDRAAAAKVHERRSVVASRSSKSAARAVLDFIAAALFADREAGVQLAAKIAAGDADPEAGSAHHRARAAP